MDPINESHVSEYQAAVAEFRNGDCRPFTVYAAAMLDAASRLIDPAGVAYVAEDRDAGTTYDVVNARVWRRLCEFDEIRAINAERVLATIREEYGVEFGTLLMFNEGDLEVVHQGTAADAPPAAAEVARLVSRQLWSAQPIDQSR